MTNNFYIQVPNISQDQNIILPSSSGILALTSDMSIYSLPNKPYNINYDYRANNYSNGIEWGIMRGGNYTGEMYIDITSYANSDGSSGWGSDAIRFGWQNNSGTNGPGGSATLMEINNDKQVKIPGTLVVSGTNVPSDIRLKNNITTINSDNDYMNIIRNLELKKYKYNSFYSVGKDLAQDELVFGWIAQEVHKIYPQAVSIEKKINKYTDKFGKEYEIPDLHTVKKNKLYDLSVAGVKYLDKIVEEQKNEIQNLKSDNETLKKDFNLLKDEINVKNTEIDNLRDRINQIESLLKKNNIN